MRLSIKHYFSGIEEKIIEEINYADNCLYISVAWFTSDDIKKALLKKIKSKKIDLKILIDDNQTNDKYFFGKSEYDELYERTKKVKTKFLHHKIILIDSKIVITGSYNLTNNARKNLENIVIINSQKFNDNYTRVFNFLYEDNYLDKNVKLLYKYPEFARNLLSTYHRFNKTQFLKYQSKIEIGDCYSYFNGFNDQVEYVPGLIFNESIRHKKVNTTDIFHKDYISTEIKNLPIDKSAIKDWVKSNRINNIIDSFREHEHLYNMINDEIEIAENSIEKYFKRKIDNCYSYSKLEKLIKNNIDIIIEDELWKTNFEPFLNNKIIDNIFEKLNPKKNFW